MQAEQIMQPLELTSKEELSERPYREKLRKKKPKTRSVKTPFVQSKEDKKTDSMVVQHDCWEVYLQKYHKNISFVDRNGKPLPKPSFKSKILVRKP